MALGTFTKTDDHGFSPNDIHGVVRGTIVCDNSYATGGYAGIRAYLTEKLDRTVRPYCAIGRGSAGGAGYVADYDVLNDKLKVYVGATQLEVANATDLSALTLDVTFWVK